MDIDAKHAVALSVSRSETGEVRVLELVTGLYSPGCDELQCGLKRALCVLIALSSTQHHATRLGLAAE